MFYRNLVVVLSLCAWAFCLPCVEAADQSKAKRRGNRSWPTVLRTFKGNEPFSFATDPAGKFLLTKSITAKGKRWIVYSVDSGEEVQALDGFTGWPVKRLQEKPDRNPVCFQPLETCSLRKIDARWTAYLIRNTGSHAGAYFWNIAKKQWQPDLTLKMPSGKKGETVVGSLFYVDGERYAACIEKKTQGNPCEQQERRIVVFDPKTGVRHFETFWHYRWNDVRVSSDGKYLFARCENFFLEDPAGPDVVEREFRKVGWKLERPRPGFHVWKTSETADAEIAHLPGDKRLWFPQSLYLPVKEMFILQIRDLPMGFNVKGICEVYHISPWKKARDLKHMHKVRLFGAIGKGSIVAGGSRFRFVFWNVDTGKSKAISMDGLSADGFECVARNGRVFTTHADGSIRVWGIRSKQ